MTDGAVAGGVEQGLGIAWSMTPIAVRSMSAS